MKNKSSILFFVMLIVLTHLSKGQKLHAFLFCKTLDDSIGTSVSINYVKMSDELKKIANNINYKYTDHSKTGTDYTFNQVLTEIDTSKIGPNDIVFLYCSSHGAKSPDDLTPFPQLDIPDTLFSSYKLYENLLRKKPKMLFAMVEACSDYLNIVPQSIKQNGFLLVGQGYTPPKIPNKTANERNNIRKLFSSNCNIIISAGQPGKTTYATPFGSIFTNSFLKAFDKSIQSLDTAKVNWDEILHQCSIFTSDESTYYSKESYHPIWFPPSCSNNGSLDVNDTDYNMYMGDNLLLVASINQGRGRKRDSLGISQRLFVQGLDLSLIKRFHIDTNAFLNIPLNNTPIIHSLKLNIKSKYIRFTLSRNHFHITVQIDGSEKELNSISMVKYYLDVTMPDPIVDNHDSSTNFSIKFSVWGEYPIKAEVYFKNGSIVELYGDIKFDN